MARRGAARHRLPAGAEDLRRDLSRAWRSRPPATARSGTGRRASTASPSWRATAAICVERRRGLPGDPDDTHSRYLEASAHGVRGRLDLPAQRQSAAGAEVRLQARLVRAADRACREPDRAARAGAAGRRLQRRRHRRQGRHLQPRLVAQGRAAAAGKPRRLPRACSPRAGPTRSMRCTKASRSTPSGTTSATASRATPACASITCCSTRRRGSACRRPASTARCAAARSRATTPRRGWCSTETAKRRAIRHPTLPARLLRPVVVRVLRRRALALVNLAFVRAPNSRIRSAVRWPKFLVAMTARLVSVSDLRSSSLRPRRALGAIGWRSCSGRAWPSPLRGCGRGGPGRRCRTARRWRWRRRRRRRATAAGGTSTSWRSPDELRCRPV